MHRILTVLAFSLALLPVSAQLDKGPPPLGGQQSQTGFTTRGGVESGAAYDILGLKLGMTAEEAERVLYSQTKIMPPPPNGREWKQGRYLVDSRAPQIGGEGFPVTLIAYAPLNLMLTFVEVPRGEARGPELLWQVTYRPELKTPDPLKPTHEALAELEARLTAKFGPPFPEYGAVRWCKQQFANGFLYKKSGLTYLLLESSGDLTLANERLQSHMREVYASRKAAPPI